MTGSEVITVAVLLALVWLMWKITRRSFGSDRDSFMTKIVKLSVLVLLVAGGLVWILDRAEENNADDGPPAGSGSGGHAPHQPSRHQSGGDKNR